MYNLKIISASVRPTRKGPVMARWITEFAEKNSDFEVELIDLGELNLPMLDKPKPASTGEYLQEHTKDWSRRITEADAFIFVTPVYNGGYPGSLRNALEFLFAEWAHKAAGILSYGHTDGGAGAAKALAGDLTALNTMPIPNGVTLVNFEQYIGDDNVLKLPADLTEKAQEMMDELKVWTEALAGLRKQ